MSATTALTLLAVSWIAIGFGASYLMARRGHDPLTWWYMGALLGPLAIAVGMVKVRQERAALGDDFHVGTAAAGAVDVLVGVDGSPESLAAIHDVLAIVGQQIGRLCLAVVEDFDAPMRLNRSAHRTLDAAAADLPYRDPGRTILTGKPASALIEHATKGGYDLIVVGSRGAGLSKVLLGSVAQQLARSSPVPVLIARHSPRKGP